MGAAAAALEPSTFPQPGPAESGCDVAFPSPLPPLPSQALSPLAVSSLPLSSLAHRDRGAFLPREMNRSASAAPCSRP